MVALSTCRVAGKDRVLLLCDIMKTKGPARCVRRFKVFANGTGNRNILSFCMPANACLPVSSQIDRFYCVSASASPACFLKARADPMPKRESATGSHTDRVRLVIKQALSSSSTLR